MNKKTLDDILPLEAKDGYPLPCNKDTFLQFVQSAPYTLWQSWVDKDESSYSSHSRRSIQYLITGLTLLKRVNEDPARIINAFAFVNPLGTFYSILKENGKDVLSKRTGRPIGNTLPAWNWGKQWANQPKVLTKFPRDIVVRNTHNGWWNLECRTRSFVLDIDGFDIRPYLHALKPINVVQTSKDHRYHIHIKGDMSFAKYPNRVAVVLKALGVAPSTVMGLDEREVEAWLLQNYAIDPASFNDPKFAKIRVPGSPKLKDDGRMFVVEHLPEYSSDHIWTEQEVTEWVLPDELPEEDAVVVDAIIEDEPDVIEEKPKDKITLHNEQQLYMAIVGPLKSTKVREELINGTADALAELVPYLTRKGGFPISQNILAKKLRVTQQYVSKILTIILSAGILKRDSEHYIQGKKSKVYHFSDEMKESLISVETTGEFYTKDSTLNDQAMRDVRICFTRGYEYEEAVALILDKYAKSIEAGTYDKHKTPGYLRGKVKNWWKKRGEWE